MSNIVERLRRGDPCGDCKRDRCACVIMEDAADEITRLRAEVEDLGNRLHHVHRLWANNEHALRAENKRLRAALEPFACMCSVKGEGVGGLCFKGSCLYWNARAAIRALKSGTGDTP